MTEKAVIFFDKFKGIRNSNPLSDPYTGVMSALSMKNIELKYSGNGGNVGIYTMLGNREIAALSDVGQTIYGQWESVQQGIRRWYVYAVDETKGYLYYFNYSLRGFTLIKDDFTPNPFCNAITVAQGFTDYFFFTNGVDAAVAVSFEGDAPIATSVNMVDAEGRNIRGLGLESYDGRVVMLCQNRVHWSVQGNIFDWSTLAGTLTDAAYQEFDRNTTACIYYDNKLIVFTEDYSVAFVGNPADTTDFQKTGASGGGCSSFGSVLKFDNKVFYYDHKARNIFAYYLYDVGQTRPSEGYANDIRNYFDLIDGSKLDRIYLLPCVVEERNEIWFKIPTVDGSIILILDYTKGEWILRDEQGITSFLIYNNQIYSSFKNKILKEYIDSTFDGEFKGAEYVSNIINLGSDSSKKVVKGHIFITLDSKYFNDFYIEFTRDDNPEKTKVKHIRKRFGENVLVWVDDDNDLSGGYWTDDDEDVTGGVWMDDSSYNVILRLIGLAPFNTLQMRIYTLTEPQDFAIKRIEFSRLKVRSGK